MDPEVHNRGSIDDSDNEGPLPGDKVPRGQFKFMPMIKEVEDDLKDITDILKLP